MKYFTQKEAAKLVRDPRSFMEGAAITIGRTNYSDDMEIHVQDVRGPGYIVNISRGPAGLSVRVSRAIGGGSEPLYLTAYHYGRPADKTKLPHMVEASEVEATIYATDDYSQDFKRWILGKDDGVPFPERADYTAAGQRRREEDAQ